MTILILWIFIPIWVLVAQLLWRLSSHARVSSAQCPACGYDVSRCPEARCSECGADLMRIGIVTDEMERAPHRVRRPIAAIIVLLLPAIWGGVFISWVSDSAMLGLMFGIVACAVGCSLIRTLNQRAIEERLQAARRHFAA